MPLWLHLHQRELPDVLIVGFFLVYDLMHNVIHIYFSVGELEKLYSLAVLGSEEEKLAASKILCGASLLRGWNIQVA
jgi:hypothetical protein